MRLIELNQNKIVAPAYHFAISGQPTSCKVFGHGHINYTLLMNTDTGCQYILQRINKHVFQDPKALMENVGAISRFLQEKVSNPREALHFIPTHEGVYYYLDADAQYWRCYEFANGICLEAPETEADFYESAIAFGRFQELLSDFPADTLIETIPEFHNTINRYRLFQTALEKDVCNRAKDIQPEISFILARKEEAGTLQRMRESGELPLRVTHNDTKLNNVLLDKETRKALCVLDLDTVMPGLSLYDFGDSIRFGAATAEEDEKDLSKMSLNLRLFEIYTRGFLKACSSLTPLEVKMLPMGAKIITLELAVRFLTDYLEGDHYFKTEYPEHNLVRARAQLKLVADMEEKWLQMQNIVEQIAEN